MSLRDRLKSATAGAGDDRKTFEQFGILENPFPSASQSSNNPHLRTGVDDMVEIKLESFIRTKQSEVLVVEGTQGVGKTNLLNHYEKELTEVLPSIGGFYVIRYLADPEASFDGILRHLFQELGVDFLERLGEELTKNRAAIEVARSREMRVALQSLASKHDDDEMPKAFLEWLLGSRVLNRHKDLLKIQFRLDTVESKTIALRDLVYVSNKVGMLNGIFLLLDELEKQDGVLSATYVVRYLSAMRAIIDALPQHLFMMIALTPDALRRYSLALPAFRSRLQDRIELAFLVKADVALELAKFYMDVAAQRARQEKGEVARSAKEVLSNAEITKVFEERLRAASARGDQGVRHRDFLHQLHTRAEAVIYAS